MSHPETVRRAFLIDPLDAEALDAEQRRIKMRMQLEGLSNVQIEVTQYGTGDCELFATGERRAS